MIRFAIRFDDPSATSKHAVEARVIEELSSWKLPATFAVVPFRKTQSGEKIPYGTEHATHFMSSIDAGLLEIALHGYTHSKSGLSPDDRNSEFLGVPFTQQKDWIAEGKAHLESVFGPIISGFVPPFNSYDAQTLNALAASGLTYLSADRRTPPPTSIPLLPVTCKLYNLREAVEEARRFIRMEPVIILVLHHYDFDRDESDPPGKVYSYKEFGDILAWLKEQPDIQPQTLRQVASGLSGKSLYWHRHDKWRSRLPGRFRHWLPNLCFITRSYRFPSTKLVSR